MKKKKGENPSLAMESKHAEKEAAFNSKCVHSNYDYSHYFEEMFTLLKLIHRLVLHCCRPCDMLEE